MTSLFVALFIAALTPSISARQAASPQNLVPVPEETALVAVGWKQLGSGDAVGAAAQAAAILAKYPQSVPALSLLTEAEIARGGALTALTSYELWLGARTLDNPYVVRRIALALLREASSRPAIAAPALKALGEDGDAQALTLLRQRAASGSFMDLKTLAELGDDRSVDALVDLLQKTPSRNADIIAALAAARNRRAVPAMLPLLNSPEPDTRARAADALGKMGAIEAVDKIRPLLEEGLPFSTRFSAASALCRLRDASGLNFMRGLLTSSHGYIRAQAAEALSVTGPDEQWLGVVRRLVSGLDIDEEGARALTVLLSAQIIAPYDRTAAETALNGLLRDANPAVREAAAMTLATQVATDFATLRRLLRSSDQLTPVTAAARILRLTR